MRRMSLIFVFVFLIAISAHGQGKKGGGSTCPVVTPPVTDTSCYAGSGCLDPYFNSDGYILWSGKPQNRNAVNAVAVQSDGKIVGAGDIAGEGSLSDFLVVRFNENGSIDDTFGSPDPLDPFRRLGYTSIPLSTSSDWARSVAIQPDGKILAGGYANGASVILRFNEDGSIDNSFGTDGKVIISQLTGTIDSIVLQEDNKILVSSTPNFSIARITTSGTLDQTFGTGGIVTVNPTTAKGGSGRPWSLAIQRIPAIIGEERIVAGGWGRTSAGSSATFALMRFKPGGAIDTSFGSSGRVSTAFSSFANQARVVKIDPLNRIVAGGLVENSACTKSDFAVARYTENGLLDSSFSGDGKATLDVFGDQNSGNAMVLRDDGRTVLGGNARYLNTSGTYTYHTVLVQFDLNGNPDPSFGPGTFGNGVVTTFFPEAVQSSYILGMTTQQDGKILAGGVSSNRVMIARYLN